jgi:predicted nucleotidyltransferase
MGRDEVLKILVANRELLAARGVKSLRLFGSVARDEATGASDVDLLVDFDRPTGLFGLIRLQQYIEELLGCKVDLGTSDSLKPRVRARVLEECVHVA